MDTLLIRTTGLVGLSLGMAAMTSRKDARMKGLMSCSSVAWSANLFLLGAYSSSALSLVSASRQLTCWRLAHLQGRAQALLCAMFVLVTLTTGVLTWQGAVSALTLFASVCSTVAMFYLAGTPLRLAMALSSALWLINAFLFHAWEQVASGSLTLLATAVGLWQLRQTAKSSAE